MINYLTDNYLSLFVSNSAPKEELEWIHWTLIHYFWSFGIRDSIIWPDMQLYVYFSHLFSAVFCVAREGTDIEACGILVL